MKGIVYIAQNRYYADPDGGHDVFKLGHTEGNSWEDVERRWRQGRGPTTNYPGEVRPVFAVFVDDMESVEREMQGLLVGARILGGGKEWFCGNVERTKSALKRFPEARELERSEEVVLVEEAQEAASASLGGWTSFAGWTPTEVGIEPGDILECVKPDCPAFLEGAEQNGNKTTFVFRWEGHERDGDRMSINTAASIIDGYPTNGPARFRAPERLRASPKETLVALIRRIRAEAAEETE